MNHKTSVSYVIAIYNEEEILLKSVNTLKKNLDKILGSKNYEVILVDNGSFDKTKSILKNINYDNFLFKYISTKGHGSALKKGIESANKEFIAITAIDIPFGFDDLIKFLKIKDEYDIVFGSKGHPKSKIFVSTDRKIASKIYGLLFKLLFNVPVNDPQGSIFFKKNKIMPFLKFCNSKNAFFTTQLAINSKKAKLNIGEIPVVMYKSKRKSKYNIFFDGSKILKEMLKEIKNN